LISAVIDTVGHCNLITGPWIAGGTPRRIWFDTNWTKYDVDFFFPDVTTRKAASERLDSIYQKQLDNWHKSHTNDKGDFIVATDPLPTRHNTNNATTYTIQVAQTYVHIQLIHKEYYPSLSALWYNFDFNNCKFATDGIKIAADPTAVEDCQQNRLSRNINCQHKLAAKRVIKYSFYGFNADSEIISELLTQYNEKTIYEASDDDYV